MGMQQLPQNIEAEQAVIGSLVKENDCINDVVEIIQLKDFYREAHQIIYTAILGMYQKDIGIDLVTLINYMGKEKVQAAGGMTYITQLVDGVASTSNIKDYAKIVKEKSNRRQVIKTAQEALGNAYDERNKVDCIITQISDNLLKIDSNKGGIKDDKEVMETTLKKIEENYQNGGQISGMETGYKDLDLAINGVGKGQFVIIAGRPAMGKSVFTLNLADYMSRKYRTLIFSLEMTNEQLGMRRLAADTKIKSVCLRMGKLTDKDWEVLVKRSANIATNSKMLYDDTPGLTVNEIKARAKKAKLKYGGLDVIVVDHIGLIQGNNRIGDKRKQLEEITNQLKVMAKELDVCVIGLSQLSRAPEQRQDHRPILADLRESGSIEQDADVVIGLYRDEYYKPNTKEKGIMEAIILKQRDGRCGTIKLAYVPEIQFVANMLQNRA